MRDLDPLKSLRDTAARRRARILKLHLAGKSQADIARNLGISRQRVQQLIKRAADELEID
jgi:DNA-binding transcriptional regulator LsrR (DeoR family)